MQLCSGGYPGALWCCMHSPARDRVPQGPPLLCAAGVSRHKLGWLGRAHSMFIPAACEENTRRAISWAVRSELSPTLTGRRRERAATHLFYNSTDIPTCHSHLLLLAFSPREQQPLPGLVWLTAEPAETKVVEPDSMAVIRPGQHKVRSSWISSTLNLSRSELFKSLSGTICLSFTCLISLTNGHHR